MNTIKSVFLILLSISFAITLNAKDRIQRVEPPNWWVGMKNSSLQLLVYGDEIGSLQPALSYEGVSIERVIRVKSPNYLFIDLKIAPETKPGEFRIQFKDGKKVVANHQYSLWEREENSETRQGFTNSDVLYLITPDRFVNANPDNDVVAGMKEGLNRSKPFGRHGGDIEGMRNSLSYLKEMGITAIWLNPVLENDMPSWSYHGYAITDFYKVDSRFGSNEEFRQMAKEAKDMGIKLIMDMILNHCGKEHWWMTDLPTDDWLNFQNEPYQETNHRKSVIQDPYVSNLDKTIMTDGWFVPAMPDMNQRNELMATYLTQNSIWWVEYADLGGIRMDTYPYPDIYYMADWTRDVMNEYPNFNIVGEEWNYNPAMVSFYQRGKINPNGYTSELPSLMDFPLQNALSKALTEEEGWTEGWMRLYEMLANDFLYPEPNNLVVFPDNHDMDRFFAQVEEDIQLFKLGLAYILTVRGIPQLYYGTELLMTNPGNGNHGLIRGDFPGGWEGDEVNAFTGKGLTEDQKSAKSFLTRLLNWRKDATAVHTGQLTHFIPENGVYVYFRYDDKQKVMVILNKNDDMVKLKLDRFKEVLQDAKTAESVLDLRTIYRLDGPTIDVPAKSPLILEMR